MSDSAFSIPSVNSIQSVPSSHMKCLHIWMTHQAGGKHKPWTLLIYWVIREFLRTLPATLSTFSKHLFKYMCEHYGRYLGKVSKWDLRLWHHHIMILLSHGILVICHYYESNLKQLQHLFCWWVCSLGRDSLSLLPSVECGHVALPCKCLSFSSAWRHPERQSFRGMWSFMTWSCKAQRIFSFFPCVILFWFGFFCSAGAWTQDLHLEQLHQPFFAMGVFKIGSRTICPDWLQLQSFWSLPSEELGLQAWVTCAWHKGSFLTHFIH
jgi:hypothetical protein